MCSTWWKVIHFPCWDKCLFAKPIWYTYKSLYAMLCVSLRCMISCFALILFHFNNDFVIDKECCMVWEQLQPHKMQYDILLCCLQVTFSVRLTNCSRSSWTWSLLVSLITTHITNKFGETRVTAYVQVCVGMHVCVFMNFVYEYVCWKYVW